MFKAVETPEQGHKIETLRVNEKEIYLQSTRHFITCHSRSNRPEVFCKKGVLRNFAKFV